MAYAQPASSDPLNSPSHSKLHRIFAADESAADESVMVNADGSVLIPKLITRFKASLNVGAAELVGADTEPMLVGVAGAQTNWSELQFSDSADGFAPFVIAGSVTKDYQGGPVTFRLRWKATATSGDVKFGVAVISAHAGDQIDTAYNTAHNVVQTVNGTTELYNEVNITFTPTGTELVAGYDWFVQISRLGTDVLDTMTGDAKLVSIGVWEV